MNPKNPFRPNLKLQRLKAEKQRAREIRLPQCPECERPMSERTQGKLVILTCKCGYTEPVEFDLYER